MILLTEMRVDSISSPRTGTHLTFGHLLFLIRSRTRSRNGTTGTAPSELSSSSISINIIHLMLARRDQSAVLLPLQHTFQQSQPLANVDSLNTSSVINTVG
jgi:hypothetical protein